VDWIVHFRESVYGLDMVDVRVTERDDQCELGRWIYGEAAHLRHLPEYEAARQAHAAFHACAAEVVRLTLAGRHHEAKLAVDHGGRLRSQSAAMVRAFLWLSQRLTSKRLASSSGASIDGRRQHGVSG